MRNMHLLQKYFSRFPEKERSSAAIAYLAAIDAVAEKFPAIAQSIVQELRDQRSHLKLIASENFCSLPVQLAMGNLLTDKYSEGYPFHRFYAGCENVDAIETVAVNELKKIFNCDHAYVQPHSGAQANAAVMLGALQPGDKILGFDLSHGGHLTHGSPVNFSGKLYRPSFYGVHPDTGRVDYDAMEKTALAENKGTGIFLEIGGILYF